VLGRGVDVELLGQPALADAGLAGEQHEVRSPALEGHRESGAQHPHLLLAPDERRAGAAPAVPRRDEGLTSHEGVDRFVAAAHGDQAGGVVAHDVGRLGVGGRPHEHLAGLGGGLQPRRHVHGVAHRRVLAARPQGADEHLAAVDADAHAHGHADLGAVHRQRRLHLEGGAHGSLGVVLMGDRGAEQRHDLVAHDLVDPPTVVPDVGDEPLEPAVDEVLQLLRVGPFGKGREPDEVGEHDGDDAALLGAGEEGVAARGAEARPLRNRGPARGALHGVQRRRWNPALSGAISGPARWAARPRRPSPAGGPT
jgi:hypothetical protein